MDAPSTRAGHARAAHGTSTQRHGAARILQSYGRSRCTTHRLKQEEQRCNAHAYLSLPALCFQIVSGASPPLVSGVAARPQRAVSAARGLGLPLARTLSRPLPVEALSVDAHGPHRKHVVRGAGRREGAARKRGDSFQQHAGKGSRRPTSRRHPQRAANARARSRQRADSSLLCRAAALTARHPAPHPPPPAGRRTACRRRAVQWRNGRDIRPTGRTAAGSTADRRPAQRPLPASAAARRGPAGTAHDELLARGFWDIDRDGVLLAGGAAADVDRGLRARPRTPVHPAPEPTPRRRCAAGAAPKRAKKLRVFFTTSDDVTLGANSRSEWKKRWEKKPTNK